MRNLLVLFFLPLVPLSNSYYLLRFRKARRREEGNFCGQSSQRFYSQLIAIDGSVCMFNYLITWLLLVQPSVAFRRTKHAIFTPISAYLWRRSYAIKYHDTTHHIWWYLWKKTSIKEDSNLSASLRNGLIRWKIISEVDSTGRRCGSATKRTTRI